VIGAGPAGLTAAYELCARTDIQPVVLEASAFVGGIARTEVYNGKRIDIGGHRFFSKSEKVIRWWKQFMPFAEEVRDDVMLTRQRMSLIFWRKKYFDYPLSLSVKTCVLMGPLSLVKSGLGYLKARVAPIRPELTLEDFFINRFGRELYRNFFEKYTEKVWGRPCSQISAEWGAQRIKGISLAAVVKEVLLRPFRSAKSQSVETSLISRFWYPAKGPGQFWEVVAKRLREQDVDIRFECRAKRFVMENNRVTAVEYEDSNGEVHRLSCDYVISSMPVKELIAGMQVPEAVANIASALEYRDFFTVGLLLKDLKMPDSIKNNVNWVYTQDPSVKVGRLQFFDNWSPYMSNAIEGSWIGLEFFCFESDECWRADDEQLIRDAVDDLVRIELIRDKDELLEGCVIRAPKAYPAYWGAYSDFDQVVAFLNGVENVYPIGRNGMHRYNNMDHSMLSAMAAVDAIAGSVKKETIWSINNDSEYHESGK
jgi:protoporphyrinogen oxidase